MKKKKPLKMCFYDALPWVSVTAVDRKMLFYYVTLRINLPQSNVEKKKRWKQQLRMHFSKIAFSYAREI
jgi:hypothetical protein